VHAQGVKGYIEPLVTSAGKPTRPISDVDYFPVPKAECPVTGEVLHIRVVYNGMLSGLNEAVWAPHFLWLPTPNTALRQLDYGYHCVDFDLGEMFLKFPLDKRLRKYAGVWVDGISHLLNEMRPLARSEIPLNQFFLKMVKRVGLGCSWVSLRVHIIQ